MPFDSRFVFVAAMDVDPEKEDLFNEIYDTEHIPNLLGVDGVISVSRSKKGSREPDHRGRDGCGWS